MSLTESASISRDKSAQFHCSVRILICSDGDHDQTVVGEVWQDCFMGQAHNRYQPCGDSEALITEGVGTQSRACG